MAFLFKITQPVAEDVQTDKLVTFVNNYIVRTDKLAVAVSCLGVELSVLARWGGLVQKLIDR